jgi:hypothetical protein
VKARLAPTLLLALASSLPVFAQQPPPPAPAAAPPAVEGSWAPDVPEPGSVEKIKEYTTAPEYLPESVSYVPDSATVPSPTKALGHLAGAPDELSRVADVHGYFRKLAAATNRVRVEVIGTSEEGREMIVAFVSDAENLAGRRYAGKRSRALDSVLGFIANADRTGGSGLQAPCREEAPRPCPSA